MKNPTLSNAIFFVIGIIIGGVVTFFLLSPNSFYSDSMNVKDGRVSNVPPAEVSAWLNKYKSQIDLKKLKVLGENGERNLLESIIIQDSIITNLKELTRREHPKDIFEGIALNFAINERGTTTVISALIQGSENGKYLHLIPRIGLPPEIRKLYFYDHINVCPYLCPENQADLYIME